VTGAGRLLLDLHSHTHHSYDAQIRPADYERAHAEGRLDVVAITDHNTITGALELREQAGFPVIVGQEIDTADGELIGLFLEEPVPAGLAAIETAERIRAQGGLVYLQHPFYRLVRGRMRSAVREDLRGRGLIDIVEAANRGPVHRRRERAGAGLGAGGGPAAYRLVRRARAVDDRHLPGVGPRWTGRRHLAARPATGGDADRPPPIGRDSAGGQGRRAHRHGAPGRRRARAAATARGLEVLRQTQAFCVFDHSSWTV
jgi:hypothetical protein